MLVFAQSGGFVGCEMEGEVSAAGILVIRLQVQSRLVVELCKLCSNCSPLGFTSQFLIQLPLMLEVEAAQSLN